MLSLEKFDARLLLKVSKYSLIVGLCLAAAGAFLGHYPGALAAVEVIAFLALAGGFYLRRKAQALHRRFDWREGHVSA